MRCFDPLYPIFVHQLAVQFLQVHGTKFLQRNLADIRSNVVVDVATVGLMGGRPDLDFAHILKPLVHPLRHCVLARPGEVNFCKPTQFSQKALKELVKNLSL